MTIAVCDLYIMGDNTWSFHFQMSRAASTRQREACARKLFDKYDYILQTYGAPGYKLSYFAVIHGGLTVVLDMTDRDGAQVKYEKLKLATDNDLDVLEQCVHNMVHFARHDLLRFIPR